MAAKMNLSFAGCGFLGIYHVGVAVCFKKYAPHLLLHRISGASAGALAACCLLCDMPLGEMTSDFFRVVNEARSHSLGPFSPRFNIQTCLLEGLQKFLPPDAHERVNGKLHISLTRVYDGKNVIVSQFNSREDLLQALLCACFIPVFSGILPPRFHGVRYMDGAFSDNLPTLDENTVTVSPFCGESDICPRDNSSQMFHVNWANTSIELSKQNINRFRRILFPPRPEILSSFCQQGFDDALNFLHRNNLISCTRCLSVQSTFCVSDQPKQLEEQLLEEYDPECSECKECTQHRQNAIGGSMPDTVLTVFQTYMDQANKGLMNWVFRHRGAKLLKALSLPATLPADIVCATLAKLMVATPAIGSQLWSVSQFALKTLNSILIRMPWGHQVLIQLSANLQCQIAYTQYSGPQWLTSKGKRVSHRGSSLLDIRVDNGTELISVITGENNNELIEPHHHHRQHTKGHDETHDEDHPDYDTFNHILQAISHHDAMYAYYYMDDNNEVKVTEIFDMTEDASPAIQTVQERELNQQLEFDSDWETTQPDFLFSDPYSGNNMIDLDELFDPCLYNNHQQHHQHQHQQQQQYHSHTQSQSYPHTHHHQQHRRSVGSHYQPFQPQNIVEGSTELSCVQWQCSQIEIGELSSDDNYLQPEADQQQALISEAAALLLSKPQSSSAYSLIEM
ncbi:1-acylglycerol-3-phosphate O-acyltransferase Pnpla3-like isoform X1 [Topomyia yanbarensis]|uniref:1-acylglycerol-3-phosphate O-acyltransferase Pnpla3-like isoform X1 n=1 Tax=Topomyia yanbarensis TaxID=2498891 RepID=UPI00273BF017|nr:1-acylglycerol-3-phosphate O-acyltransferase Pnpla3-like isoform X1 [Topomyia yanbarensis]